MQTIPQGYQQPISAPVAPNNMQASNGQAQMYQAAPQQYNGMKAPVPNGNSNIPMPNQNYPPNTVPRGAPMYYYPDQQNSGNPTQMSVPPPVYANQPRGVAPYPNPSNPQAKPGAYNPSIPQNSGYMYQGGVMPASNTSSNQNMAMSATQQQQPQQQPQQSGNMQMHPNYAYYQMPNYQGAPQGGNYQMANGQYPQSGPATNNASYRYPPNPNQMQKPVVMMPPNNTNSMQKPGTTNPVQMQGQPNSSYSYPPANYNNYSNGIPYTIGQDGKPVYATGNATNAAHNTNTQLSTSGSGYAQPVNNAGANGPYSYYNNPPPNNNTAGAATSRPTNAPPVSPYMVNMSQPNHNTAASNAPAPSQPQGRPVSIYMQGNAPLPSTLKNSSTK